MGTIHLLDSETINQIAAGEVIERPASIAKELIENAIDAGSTAITCEIKGGGIAFLRVTDNGKGIDKDDIRIAFLRHATSKLTDASELSGILSLGFRGEALSSIAAVARVELSTKRAEDFLGSHYEINGGEEADFSEIGCPNGTTFIIRDVFYNVPARKKFLKSAVTEGGYIAELLSRLAVSHPDISFQFINQGKTVLYTSGNKNPKDAVFSVFGKDISNNLIPLDYHSDRFTLTGFLGKPVIARGNRNFENIFINGRYVRSSLISRAIEEAYKPYFMLHKFPFTCLMFSFPPNSVDVNVHPTKMEVRIHNGDLLYKDLVSLIGETIRNQVLIQETLLSEAPKPAPEKIRLPENFEVNRSRQLYEEMKSEQEGSVKNPDRSDASSQPEPKQDREEAFSDEDLLNGLGSGISDGSKSAQPEEKKTWDEEDSSGTARTNLYNLYDTAVKPAPAVDFSSLFIGNQEVLPEEVLATAEAEETKKDFMSSAGPTRSYRIIGQLFKTYWLVEMENELFLIDQHAAHEKILYERTVKRYKNHEVLSQLVNPAPVLSLSAREAEVMENNMVDFTALGFEIEHFGGREYRITAVPTDLYMLSYENLFLDMLDTMTERPKIGPSDLILARIATMSCKAAIKGNTTITKEEAEHLISELLTLENPYHCPHGRPVIISMSKYEIEKKFKRII